MTSCVIRTRLWLPAAVGALAAVWLSFSWTKSAHAQNPQARAAKHYQRGAEHFKAERFAEAVTEYRAAYELAPNPLLLFNIGLALRANGEHEEALAALNEFLEETPTGDISAEAREYVRELQAELDEQRERDRQRLAAEEAARRAAEAAARSGGGERSGSSGGGLRITGVVLASGGVALLATAGVFGARAGSINDELENHTGAWTDAELARIDDGEAAETNAVALSVAGGALLIAGGVSYWLGTRSRASSSERAGSTSSTRVTEQLAIVPVLSTRSLGLSMSGRF